MARRAYRQVARAETTEHTQRAILDAAQALFREEDFGEIPLDRIAGRAGVSARTLLRHFGSREGLLQEAMADAEAAILAAREAPAGDVDAAIARLVDHYEEMGAEVVRRLSAAERYPLLRRVTESGARVHREWVEGVFAEELDPLPPAARRERVARLATATDVYAWDLLRRRHGLSRAATERSIRALVEGARRA